MEADYTSLEAAYRQARRQPGEPLLVSVEGTIAPRPAAESGPPPRPHLVVERFIGIWPRETCGNRLADSPLRNTYWKLVRLGDAPVQVADRQREPHVIFNASEARLSGYGGCNRVTGSFEVDGDRLKIGPMAATRMACPDGMEQEQRFLQAIQKVATYRIGGSHLDMMDASGAVLARFEAVALP
jgi:heat shock protein HslJ